MLGASALVLLLVPAAQVGCGQVGPVPPPHPPSFVDPTDPERVRVSIIKNPSAPMVVDWQPENRADLEVRIRSGPAVVRFDEKTFELLPHCTAAGKYNYVGMTPKEDHRKLLSRADLQGNVPLGAFKLEAYLGERGGLNVDLRMVGKRLLDVPTLRRADLTGDCAGATHYVEQLIVGAFRFASGASREAGAGATGLGMGATASTSGSSDILQVDGDFGACDRADPLDVGSPPKCSAIIRIQIVPLDRAASTDDKPSCGEGMRWDGAACITLQRVSAEARQQSQPAPAGAPAPRAASGGFECDPKNETECIEQCRLGNMASCVVAGQYMVAGGGAGARNEEKGLGLWALACKQGQGTGCTMLGAFYMAHDRMTEALGLAKAGCLSGDPEGCNLVAIQAYFGRGLPQNRAASYTLWTRACALRSWASCSNAGVMIVHGMNGVAKDPERAHKLFKLSCEAPDHSGCDNLAESYELGLGTGVNIARALELYLQSCNEGHAGSCVEAGLVAEERDKRPEIRAKALELYEKGCAVVGEVGGCMTETEMHQYYAGKLSDESMKRRSCDEGNQTALACYNAAIAHERGYGGQVNLPRANTLLQKACAAKLQKACRPAGAAASTMPSASRGPAGFRPLAAPSELP